VTVVIFVALVKIPRMDKTEYDQLIRAGYISRIAFKGEEYPYIAPFLYVFDGNFIYFLSTKYGKKMQLFQQSPHVAVEIERYSSDLANYTFVTLTGRLMKIDDPTEDTTIRKKFVELIKDKHLSKNIIAALGHSPEEPIESIITEKRTLIWKLVHVKDIVALKNV
jgi:nitroimidazol reductase NimA-like FMN-containing flavoprotein (pyridoxamine 5'-phosphate oxidase superfamily)